MFFTPVTIFKRLEIINYYVIIYILLFKYLLFLNKTIRIIQMEKSKKYLWVLVLAALSVVALYLIFSDEPNENEVDNEQVSETSDNEEENDSPSKTRKSLNKSSDDIIRTDGSNVLYIGIDNIVYISVPEIDNNDLRVSINRGSISPSDSGKYIIRVLSEGTVTVEVLATLENGTEKLASKDFMVKDLPLPNLYLANQHGGVYSINQIVSSPVLTAEYENIDYDVIYSVIKYKFTYKNNLGEKTSIQGHGNRLNPQIISIIQSSSPGSQFWIENVEVRGPTGNIFVNNIEIQIQ